MPAHPFTVGETVMVAVIGAAVPFVAVNDGISPEPVAAIPIAVFEFVHVNVPPAGILLKFVAGTVPLLHTITFAGTVTVGIGFTVTVTVFEPVQPDAVPVTVYVVVVPGVTDTGLPGIDPGIQV